MLPFYYLKKLKVMIKYIIGDNMRSNVFKMLFSIILMIPLCLNAKIVNYEDSIKYANEYIKDFKNFNDYLKVNMPYNYDMGENLHNNKFRNGGFLSKEEFKITNAYDNSYLATGIEYWTLSKANNYDMHTIDYRLSERNMSEKTDIRITEFVRNETKVTGSGTKNNPWVFIDTYNVNLISTNKNRGTLSHTKCNNISEGNETLTVPMFEGYKSIFYVCEDTYYRYYRSSCDNYFTGEINSNKYYISSNITDNTICRLNFTHRVNEVELQQCSNCTNASPKQFYIAQNQENYFKDYDAQKELTELETVPSKTGYTFKGYYRSNDFIDENLIIKADGTFKSKDLSGDKTTLIPYMKANEYTVTFDVNGGNELTSTTKKVTYDSEYGDMPKPTRTGYTFAGWYTESIDGTKIGKNDKYTIAGNQTLYAQWTPNKYIITFDSNGGEEPNPKTKEVTYESNYGDLPEPTRIGYSLKGWFTSQTGDEEITKTTTVKITKNQTLYAQWVETSLPNFYYTGKFQVVKDDDTPISNILVNTSFTGSDYNYNSNWKVRFLSTGDLTIYRLGSASEGSDFFIVGGGANGTKGHSVSGCSNGNGTCYCGGGGGAGGSCSTKKTLTLFTNTAYNITIGKAETASSVVIGADTYSAAGGGGASGAGSWCNASGGGSKGSAGCYEFGESNYKRYAGGGGSGGNVYSYHGGTWSGGSGGANGGGTGGSTSYYTGHGSAGGNGKDNTGGGGGGGGMEQSSKKSAGKGGSGIVIWRNSR